MNAALLGERKVSPPNHKDRKFQVSRQITYSTCITWKCTTIDQEMREMKAIALNGDLDECT